MSFVSSSSVTNAEEAPTSVPLPNMPERINVYSATWIVYAITVICCV